MNTEMMPAQNYQPNVIQPYLVRVRDAAVFLSISQAKLWELMKLGLFDVRKIGNRTLLTMQSLRAYADGLPRA